METWIRWKPKNTLVPKKSYFNDLTDMNNMLSFVLGPMCSFEKEWDENIVTKNKIVCVTFKKIISYRYIEEGRTMKILSMLSEHYGDDFYAEWSLFKIKNSPYFAYVSSLSDTPLDPEKYTHYAFYCADELFEVIADNEPTFELIQ